MTLGEDEIISGEHMEDVELASQPPQVHMDGSTLVEEIHVIPQNELVSRSDQAENMMTAISWGVDIVQWRSGMQRSMWCSKGSRKRVTESDG